MLISQNPQVMDRKNLSFSTANFELRQSRR